MAKILVIDDEPNILETMSMHLKKEGYNPVTASNGRTGLDKALTWEPDIIISDIRMEDMDGTELFHILRSRGKNIPFIFITAYASIKGAVTAIKEGAVDYLTKPIDHDQLSKIISTILQKSRNRESVSVQHRLVGSSAVMQQLHQRIAAVAATNATVLITGASGTGKELIAQAIHKQSRRSDKPFVPLNCAVLSRSLLESELFGYEKGAFTGAAALRKGLLEAADGGTLFFDEVSEIELPVQVKLLRVLQERCFTRVGGTRNIQMDVRIIAATNRKLEELVNSGEFRHDLYYRLNVIPINVPALCTHPEDLPELVAHFTQIICRREQMAAPVVSPSFIDALSLHTWPGNVRELENLIERILILYQPATLEKKHVESEFTASCEQQPPLQSERDRMVAVLQLYYANKSKAAAVLGMPRRTLYNKIRQYNINPDEYSPVPPVP